MIVKIIPRKSNQKASFAYSARYVLGTEGGSDPLTWARTAEYVLRMDGQGEGRVAGYRITNCASDDPAEATQEILITQARNTRAKSERHLHLVVSFPPGENPEQAVLNQIEDALVESIGLSGHQRISAVHVDTEHLHAHIVINKIHPNTFKIADPHRSKLKLMEACHNLEVRFGLQKTNHGIEHDRLHALAAQFAEQEPALVAERTIELAARKVASFINQDAAGQGEAGQGWGSFYDHFSRDGLQVVNRQLGLAVINAHTGSQTALRDIDERLTVPGLTVRLGTYQAPTAVLGDAGDRDAAYREATFAAALDIVSGQARAEKQKSATKTTILEGTQKTLLAQGTADALTVLKRAQDQITAAQKENVLEQIKATLIGPIDAVLESDKNPSWHDVHRLMASEGLTIAPKGAGMIITADRGVEIKPSDVDRGWSAGMLKAHFGDYQPPDPDLLATRPESKRQQNPEAGEGSLAKWTAFYRAFAARGVRVEATVQGLAVRTGQGRAGQVMPLQSLDQQFALGNLINTLGDYQAPAPIVAELSQDKVVIETQASHREQADADMTDTHGGKTDGHAAKTGEQSLATWAQEVLSAKALALLDETESDWQAMHELMARHGLVIKPRSAGLVIASKKEGIHIKASDVHRQLSRKFLEGIFGQYQPPGAAVLQIVTETEYSRTPAIGKPAKELWMEYQACAESGRRQNKKYWEDYRAKRKMLNDSYQQRFQQLEKSNDRGWTRRHRIIMLSAERRRVMAEHRLAGQESAPDWKQQTWLEFLTIKAGEGHEQARKSLARYRGAMWHYNNGVEAAEKVEFTPAVMKGMRVGKPLKSGAIRYYMMDGGILSSTEDGIDVVKETGQAVAGLAALAAERWPDKTLDLRGDTAFQDKVRQLVEQKDLGVMFSVSEQERTL